MNVEQIKKNYAQMDDWTLERIAKFEVASLLPEVQEIIIAEIKKRGLDANLLSGVQAQKQQLTVIELYESVNKIRGLDCPICGLSGQELVGGVIRKVRSYLFFSQHEERPLIACRSCVDKEQKSQLIKNGLLGWWAFPAGLVKTPLVIFYHFRDIKKKNTISETILKEFVLHNIGELKTNWDKEENLVDFIDLKNQANY